MQGWARLPLVKAFMCLRGMALINAVTCVCEIGDFLRFDHPRKLMGFLGLVPSEDTSTSRRRQGAITKTGNEACRGALVEAAPGATELAAKVSPTIRQRQHGQPRAVVELAWKAQVRLCGQYRALSRRLKKPVVAVTASARNWRDSFGPSPTSWRGGPCLLDARMRPPRRLRAGSSLGPGRFARASVHPGTRSQTWSKAECLRAEEEEENGGESGNRGSAPDPAPPPPP